MVWGYLPGCHHAGAAHDVGQFIGLHVTVAWFLVDTASAAVAAVAAAEPAVATDVFDWIDEMYVSSEFNETQRIIIDNCH